MMSSVRVFRLLGQFVAVPILSRLLAPADYGLMAIAMPFALFAMVLADAGIGMSLVRTPLNERKEWSTSFWLSVMLGIAIALIMAALAPLIAYLFHEPSLTAMIITLGFVVITQSIHVIPAAALQQDHRFKAIATADALGTAAGILTAVGMAYQHYGAWALIGQQLVFFMVRLSISWWYSPFRPQMLFDWHGVREHVLFGRNVLGNSLLNYFSRTFDNWVVGKVISATILGFYSMAFQFARLPTMLVTGPLQYVMYAQLARIKDNPAAIGRVFLLMVRLLATVLIPIMGMVAVAHNPIFRFILSDKWAYTGVIFMLIAPATTLQSIAAVGETVVYALGRTDIQLRTTFEFCVLWVIVLLVAITHGVLAAAAAYTICVFAYHFRYLKRVLPLLRFSLRDYFAIYPVALITTALAITIYRIGERSFATLQWQKIVLSAVLACATLAASMWIQRKTLRAGIQKLNF